jgi:stage II sporulation protein D
MSWNDAALKAQAVAARTFALYNLAKRRNLPYDLDGTTLFQNFVGFKGINPKAEEIVRETRGEVLLFNGKLIYAMYSANDGGCSHSFEELFGINLPYLSTTEDGKLCNLSNLKRSFWQKGITSEDLRNFLNSVGLTNFQPITFRVLRNGCGRGLRITFVSTDGREITFPLAFFVRLSLHLPSDWFYAERKGSGYFVLKGRGFGHGLGMSQWGAYCLGEKGWNYKKILEFFYRGAVVKKIY